mgnify:CR=1 FL=1
MSRLESYEINELFKNNPSQEPQPPTSGIAVDRKQMIAEFDSEAAYNTEIHSAAKPVPKDLAEFLVNAGLLLKSGEHTLALNLFRATLMRDPDNSVALRGMGESLSQLNRHTEALPYFRAIVKNEGTPQAWARLADEAYHAQDFDEAYTSYVVSIEMGLPDGRELFAAYKNLGNILVIRTDLAAAEKMYQKAYTLNPDSDVLMVNLGSLEIHKGDLNKAVHMFRQAVAVNDSNDKAWVGLALIHREFSDSELSWANVEKALDLNPKNESAIRLVSEWALKDAEYDKAITRIEKFLQHCDQDAQMTLWLAKFFYLAGQLNNAEVEINKALDLSPHLEGAMEVYQAIREERLCRETQPHREARV